MDEDAAEMSKQPGTPDKIHGRHVGKDPCGIGRQTKNFLRWATDSR